MNNQKYLFVVLLILIGFTGLAQSKSDAKSKSVLNVIITEIITYPTAPALCNGSIELFVNNGTPPYEFEWNTGDTADAIFNLCPNIYMVTVTDFIGLSAVKTFYLDSNFTAVTYDLELVDVSCNGGSNGSASISNISGAFFYSVVWSTGDSALAIQNLSAGTYSVMVYGNGTTSESTFVINEPAPLSCDFTTVGVDPVSDSGGVLLANVSGGSGTYTYQWSSGGQSAVVQNASYGLHYLTVMDSNLCSASFQSFVDFSLLPDWTLRTATQGHSIQIDTVAKIEIYGIALERNDFIGAFFDSSGIMSCGGYAVWRENDLSFVLSGATPAGGNQSGFGENESIKWLIWDASENTYFTGAASYDSSYPSLGNYSSGGYSGIDSLQVISLEGKAYDSDSLELSNGLALLYEKQNELFYPTQKVELSFGTFRFDGLLSHDYLVQIVPDPFVNDVPVYSGNNHNWNAVSPIVVRNYTYGIDITLKSKEMISSGNGNISGSVVVGNDPSYLPEFYESFAEDFKSNDAAASILLYLFNDSMQVIDYVFTDLDGTFEFTSIPYGTFYIQLEKAGLSSNRVPIVLNETVENMEALRFILNEGTVLSVELIDDHSFKIYPQPANTFVRMDFGEEAFSGIVRLYNANGALLKEIQVHTKRQLEVDLATFNSGQYYLQFDTGTYTSVRKIVIVK